MEDEKYTDTKYVGINVFFLFSLDFFDYLFHLKVSNFNDRIEGLKKYICNNYSFLSNILISKIGYLMISIHKMDITLIIEFFLILSIRNRLYYFLIQFQLVFHFIFSVFLIND